MVVNTENPATSTSAGKSSAKESSREARARILAAASELFLEGGLAALSVRAIAKRAGVSTIGIYSHFDGKQGILDTLYIEGFERVMKAMEVMNLDIDRRAKVIAAANGYLDVAENFAAHYQLIFGLADDSYEPSPEAVAVAENAFQTLLQVAALALPATASVTEQQDNALIVWAIVHGFVGLGSHAAAQRLQDVKWRELALQAIDNHLDSLGL